MTLVETVKSFICCKYIGLCYALGRAINNSKRDSVDRNGFHAGNIYRLSEAGGVCTLVLRWAFDFGGLAPIFL